LIDFKEGRFEFVTSGDAYFNNGNIIFILEYNNILTKSIIVILVKCGRLRGISEMRHLPPLTLYPRRGS
jgi:hypothetical protein